MGTLAHFDVGALVTRYGLVHFVETGTHEGELFGIAPTGKTVSFGEMGLLRLEGGKVVESFYNTDMLSLMQQLGVGGSPAAGA